VFVSAFFKEVQRRKVYRVAAAYIIAAGFLIQIASGALRRGIAQLEACGSSSLAG
jgi:hypothetical protein